MEGFYSVREMTQRLGVEAHMLRYWEKELQLDIPRDRQGHRIYGEEEAQLLTRVSEYKKQGKPLRIIRSLIMLPGQGEKEATDPQLLPEGFEITKEPEEETEMTPPSVEEIEITPPEEELKTQRTQELLSRMVAQAVRESTEMMITEMKESILKELDYQFRLQAEREAELRREMVDGLEEHFQRVDVLLQNQKRGGWGSKLWR